MVCAQDHGPILWENMRSIVPKGYVCYRAEEPIVIDGKLDEKSWSTVPWTGHFVDINGDVKPKPSFRTQVKMLWDDIYFYIAADLEEPHVWGTITQHDESIYWDNDFEIFIDPDGDSHDYYELEINALNTTWDLFLSKPYKDGGRANNDWEITGLKTAVSIDGTINNPKDLDIGWSVECAIPWNALAEYTHTPIPPRDGDQWRVNFYRAEWDYELVDGVYRRIQGMYCNSWVWSPTGINMIHCPEKWGYVQFSIAKPGTEQYTPDPTESMRMILHDIYYAQKEYNELQGRYAASLEELGKVFARYTSLKDLPVLEITEDGYNVSVEAKLPGGGSCRIKLRQDAKITVE